MWNKLRCCDSTVSLGTCRHLMTSETPVLIPNVEVMGNGFK